MGNFCCLLETVPSVLLTLTYLFFPNLGNNYNYLHFTVEEIKVRRGSGAFSHHLVVEMGLDSKSSDYKMHALIQSVILHQNSRMRFVIFLMRFGAVFQRW